jgi:HK97 family phage prohead protease
MERIKLLERDEWVKRMADDPEDVLPMRKGYACEVKAADDEERAFDMVISTESVDRDGDTLRAAGWDIKDYKKNPVVQWAHDHHIPAIARSVATKIERGAKKLLGRPKFPEEGVHPFADMIYNLMKGKFLNAASVGFLPMQYERVDDADRRGYDFLKQSLLEFSIVNVPSNPEALTGAKAAGIDLAPMIGWAKQVLETEDGPGLWLPKHMVERALEIAENERRVIPVNGLKLMPAHDDKPAVLEVAVALRQKDISLEDIELDDDARAAIDEIVNGKLFGDPPEDPKPIDFTDDKIGKESFEKCPACGNAHKDLLTIEYAEPVGDKFAAWAACPENGPVLVRLVGDDGEVGDWQVTPTHKEVEPTNDEVTGEQLLTALLDSSEPKGADNSFTSDQLKFLAESLGQSVVAVAKDAVRQRLTALTGRLD